jgi:heat shock protein HslJ
MSLMLRLVLLLPGAAVLAACVSAPAVPATDEDNGMPTVELAGTAWLLEDLAGFGVLDRVQATLSFGSAGAVSGNGSCNRFVGKVAVQGDAITFGTLAATRMACPEAVMNQESGYFAALGNALRYQTDGTFLRIFVAGQPAPLRFTVQESEPPP